MQILVNVESSSVLADITALEAKLSALGLREFLDVYVDSFLRNRLQERFANEGDDAVGKWFPLAPATEAIRAGQGYGPAHPINVRTSEMLDFFMSSRADITVGGADALLTFPPKGASASVENKISVAQGGKAYPSTPARPVLGLSVVDQSETLVSLQKYIMQGLIGAVTG